MTRMSYQGKDKLYVVDFDGTLFYSPEDSPENKKFYQDETGIPWHITKEMAAQLTRKYKVVPFASRTGWWGKRDTLLPPLVPDIIPHQMWNDEVVGELTEARHDDTIQAVIMTGRHVGLKQEVLRILAAGSGLEIIAKVHKESEEAIEWKVGETARFVNGRPIIRYWYEINPRDGVEFKCLGDNGPCPEAVGTKPSSTLEWKLWMIDQYRLSMPDLKEIHFWEDRPEHIKTFKELANTCSEKIVVNAVPKRT